MCTAFDAYTVNIRMPDHLAKPAPVFQQATTGLATGPRKTVREAQIAGRQMAVAVSF